jgi:hypothetical protein
MNEKACRPGLGSVVEKKVPGRLQGESDMNTKQKISVKEGLSSSQWRLGLGSNEDYRLSAVPGRCGAQANGKGMHDPNLISLFTEHNCNQRSLMSTERDDVLVLLYLLSPT